MSNYSLLFRLHLASAELYVLYIFLAKIIFVEDLIAELIDLIVDVELHFFEDLA